MHNAIEVRNLVKTYESGAAAQGSHAAREKLDSEQRLFANGESTNFLVLTRQNEYSEAKQRALAARLDFNKAVARFDAAVGETLSARKLTVE